MKKQVIAFVRDDMDGLRMVDREYFMQFLKDFGPGTKLRLTLENYHPQRSVSQNALLHWYCSDLAEECGMQTEDFKMMMKMKFLTREARDKNGEVMCDENGEILTFIPSTADLDKAEMVTFIDQIRLFGIEVLNFELALPDANYKLNFQEERKKQLKK